MTAHHTRITTPATGSSHINTGRGERIASVAGAAWLLLSGFRHFRERPAASLIKAITGGYLLYRGLSGHCPISAAAGRNTAGHEPAPLLVREAFTVNRPRNEVYDYWRQLEHLPLFMKHIEEVRMESDCLSHWKMRAPGGVAHVEWKAAIMEDQPGALLSWQSVEGSDVDNAGELLFRDAPGHRGTEVYATIYYRMPAGALGKAAGKLLHKAFELQVRQDLHRFKQIMEAGETSTIEGQPAARKHAAMFLNP